ncbi:hypothetical protein J2Q11_12535 [Tenacibaculum finnmarkense genomovar finnmarkense]|uniref:hypothetical protein n=1 Tax=Tenacibaculum finnmarkense TaxID=2781243 RepID=UPI000C45C6BB|nr:hypothetical protein [Tenacibaculum finnmarkense]MBE7661258.1 hypothetical protein [Tenacibaculum finnmarkense genomovar finnmarkense]MCD8418475.1 hypothetical protein [Tenacibaculum finnmarkense genomovar finnmarkense]MCD8440420.1 hypothetical protein [Tenacibaculum finnmarkense genomovar ulcerans]MCG8186834.1 hypothetical protein [Tenacibaculum finnmarkense genomovar finnmarkense]MCG8203348.1 hypothetical protein [Tenacibaculum finnmarkense genomovar finnmarkense]
MKKPFIITFEDIKDKSKMEEFSETIRSNFISKRGTNNSYIINVQGIKNAKEIFELIQSKLSFDASFFVSELDHFYGHFNNEALEWMFEQFPEKEWTKKDNNIQDEKK